jgi:hypothetical protein
MRLSDPVASRIILVGTATYEDSSIPDLPSVRNNVHGLAEILTSPDLGGLSPTVCHTFIDLRSDQVWQLAELADQAEDVLLIYFAGHGLLSDDGRLLLALTNTKNSYPDYTSLHVDQLARAIRTSQAKIRLLILDCCYSARALRRMMGGPEQQLVIDGTYTLASAPANHGAIAPEGAQYTAFTGELISLLRTGDIREPALLSVGMIFRKLVQVLQSKGYPTPKQAHSGTAADLALVRNVLFRQAPSDPSDIMQYSAVAMRRKILGSIGLDSQLDALCDLISLAESDPVGIEELEMLAVNGYVSIVLRMLCVLALDTLGQAHLAARSVETLTYLLGEGETAVERLRALRNALTADVSLFARVPMRWNASSAYVAALRAEPNAEWGLQIAKALADIGIPFTRQIQATQELVALDRKPHALHILRGMLRDDRLLEFARTDIRAAIALLEAGRRDPEESVSELREPLNARSSGEWPIQPLLGEPPLTLFRGKTIVELASGTEIDRFGQSNGNLTYAAGTPFPFRSLVPEWVNNPYHTYRVAQSIKVLTGLAIPWFNQPGGGCAYILDRSIADLLESGHLVELRDREPPLSA